ncbi:MAG: hypothetical protein WC829_10070 [Hyphomicrobium sp.]|jgi:hypothetical protein
MGKLQQQLEEMHIQIAETATREEALVKALGDALARLDEQLLADVQTIASDHESRRTAILGELQGLAAGIGMFQIPRAAVTARADVEPEAVDYMPSAGDWREATSKIRDDAEVMAIQSPVTRTPFPHEQRRVAPIPLSLIERRRRASGG